MATVNADDNTDSQLNEAISLLNVKRIDLKKEQDLAIRSLLEEKDVLAVLPTGFGVDITARLVMIVSSVSSCLGLFHSAKCLLFSGHLLAIGKGVEICHDAC